MAHGIVAESTSERREWGVQTWGLSNLTGCYATWSGATFTIAPLIRWTGHLSILTETECGSRLRLVDLLLDPRQRNLDAVIVFR